MTQKPLPSAKVLREILAYDPETGSLTWLEREARHFSSTPTHSAVALAAQFNAKYAGKPALTAVDSGGYKSGRLFNSQVRAHRVIWKMLFDEEPQIIDHANRIRSDNRIENLRRACPRLNAFNRSVQSNNTSGIVGVSWDSNRGKWVAQINLRGKHLLRRFINKENAIKQRKTWEQAAIGS